MDIGQLSVTDMLDEENSILQVGEISLSKLVTRVATTTDNNSSKAPGAALPSVPGRLLAGVDVDVTAVQGNPTRVQSDCSPTNTPAKMSTRKVNMVAGSGEKRFSDRFFGITWLNVILVIIVTSWAVLGVLKIIIGGTYIHKCPVEDMLPIWLIVDAIIPIFFVIGFVLHLKEGSTDDLKRYGSVFLITASILSLGWSICGGVWIYTNWSKEGCNTTVGSFAFVMITVNWSVVWMWSNLCSRLLLWYYCRPRGMVMI